MNSCKSFFSSIPFLLRWRIWCLTGIFSSKSRKQMRYKNGLKSAFLFLRSFLPFFSLWFSLKRYVLSAVKMMMKKRTFSVVNNIWGFTPIIFCHCVALTVEELLSLVLIGKAVYAIVEPCVKIVLNRFEIHKMKNDKHKRKIKHKRCKIIEIVICLSGC